MASGFPPAGPSTSFLLPARPPLFVLAFAHHKSHVSLPTSKSGNCQSAWPLTQAAPARRSSMMGSHIAWVTQGDKRSVHQASTPSFPYHYIFIWATSNHNAASAAATSAGPPHVSQLHACLSPTPAANTTGLRSTSLTRSIFAAHSFKTLPDHQRRCVRSSASLRHSG